MSEYKGSDRITGFDKPRVWSVLTPLAAQLKASNLGQGFPTWQPPQFYLDYLTNQIQNGNHQYVRSYGSTPLVNAIAHFHQQAFAPHKINPLQNIVISNGGSQALFDAFMGILNQGDQVIFFDPAYDCYRSQIQMAGGKAVGLPLRPRVNQNKQKVSKRIQQSNGKIVSTLDDDWYIDFQQLQKNINQKTKILLINSPHNPVGKVFTQQELSKIANIVKKHNRIVVIQDNVYQGMTFDQLLGQKLPKIIYQKDMFERTISVYSAGKILAATGVRLGWAIGSSKIIQSVRAVHTYNVFCYYNVIQVAIAKSLQKISKKQQCDYMVSYPKKLQDLRDLLVKQLVNCKLDIDFWVPKGNQNGQLRARDYAFCLMLLYNEGVSGIPCSPFFDINNPDRQKYVRLTFCKCAEIIEQAGRRLK